jgi:hypothetical protein
MSNLVGGNAGTITAYAGEILRTSDGGNAYAICAEGGVTTVLDSNNITISLTTLPRFSLPSITHPFSFNSLVLCVFFLSFFFLFFLFHLFLLFYFILTLGKPILLVEMVLDQQVQINSYALYFLIFFNFIFLSYIG